MTREELRRLLDQHDELILRLNRAELTLEGFLGLYGSFPHEYALDGHEATDASDRDALEAERSRIAFHLGITTILAGLCGEADLENNPQYSAAGRFGRDEAIRRIDDFLRQHPNMALEEVQ